MVGRYCRNVAHLEGSERYKLRKCTIISPAGDLKWIGLPEVNSLQALRDILDGGHIEAVALPGRRYMVFKAEGKSGPHFINKLATHLAQNAESIGHDDYIAGTAVIVPSSSLTSSQS